VNDIERDFIIRRILVALDASPHSLAALAAAAELAAAMQAELQGVFVEDINLLRLAELPFTGEIGLYSSRYRTLEPAQLERQLRAQAERLRRIMAQTADRQQLNWSFQVTRGVIATELLGAAAQADLVILGKRGLSPLTRQLGSTARAILTQTAGPALVLQQGAQLKQPLLLVYDGSPSAQKALVTAAHLIREGRSPLIIFILADDQEQANQFINTVSTRLANRGLTARFRLLATSAVTRLARLLQTEPGGLLIWPADSPTLAGEDLIALLDQLHIPLLLIR
jgi:nucleotide-binding universal stress UspA family protein